MPTFRLCFSTPRLICTIISRGAIGGLNEEPRAAVDDDGLARHNVPALLASHTHVSAMSDFSPMRRIGAQVEAWNYDGVIHALAEGRASRMPAPSLAAAQS